jgi:DNA-binding transcriptional regulator YbjK
MLAVGGALCSHYKHRVDSAANMARYTPAAPKRRKPNPAERRRDLCDAAIQLLAEDGAKGLSHLKVDRKADVPDGTTSFYFRTRSALLRAVAERLAELDLESLQSVADSADSSDAGGPSRLSQVVIQAGNEPQLSHTKARYELTMQASRDPDLAAILQQATDGFTKLHREILVQLMPRGAELESAVVEDLSNVTLTFINGLMLRLAHGDRIIDSPEQLDGILSAIASGILRSPEKGRLTKADDPRPPRRRAVSG